MIDNNQLNKLAAQAFANASRHGFHDSDHSAAHYVCLIITELAEAVNAHRRNHWARVPIEKKDTIYDPQTFHPANIYFKDNFEAMLKDTVEDELADAVIRLLDFAAATGKEVKVEDWMEHPANPNRHQWEGLSFAEAIAYIMGVPYEGTWGLNSNLQHPPMMQYRISRMLGYLFAFAKQWRIDLMWHVERKMEYNTLRSHRHGKSY